MAGVVGCCCGLPYVHGWVGKCGIGWLGGGKALRLGGLPTAVHCCACSARAALLMEEAGPTANFCGRRGGRQGRRRVSKSRPGRCLNARPACPARPAHCRTFSRPSCLAASSSFCSLGPRLRGSGLRRRRSSSVRLLFSWVRMWLCLQGTTHCRGCCWQPARSLRAARLLQHPCAARLHVLLTSLSGGHACSAPAAKLLPGLGSSAALLNSCCLHVLHPGDPGASRLAPAMPWPSPASRTRLRCTAAISSISCASSPWMRWHCWSLACLSSRSSPSSLAMPTSSCGTQHGGWGGGTSLSGFRRTAGVRDGLNAQRWTCAAHPPCCSHTS